jgi:hypothetical protein
LSHDSYLYDFIYYTISSIILISGLYWTGYWLGRHNILSNLHVPHIRTISMDINVNDDHTVGCPIASAADAHLLSSNSESDDISDNDCGSCAKSCYPVGLKSDSGGQGSVLAATEKRMIYHPLQKHAKIFFLCMIS